MRVVQGLRFEHFNAYGGSAMPRVQQLCKLPVAVEALEGRLVPSGAAVVITEPVPRPPSAWLAPDTQQPFGGHVRGGAGPHVFALAISSDSTIDEASVRGNPAAVRVVGPNGYDVAARLGGRGSTSGVAGSFLTDITELYYFEIPAPGGRWDPSDNGRYTVSIGANQIKDRQGYFVPGGDVGAIAAFIPGHGPDLRASAVTMARRPARPGARRAVRLTLSNVGERPLRGMVSVSVGLVSATDAPGTNGPFVAEAYKSLSHASVRAGGSKRYTLRLRISADLPPGDYRLVAWATCLGNTIGTDAFNNATDGPVVTVRAGK